MVRLLDHGRRRDQYRLQQDYREPVQPREPQRRRAGSRRFGRAPFRELLPVGRRGRRTRLLARRADVPRVHYSLANPSAGGLVPGGSGGPLSANYFQLGGGAEGRVYWPDVQNFFESTPVSRNPQTGAVAPGGDAIKVITGDINTGLQTGGLGGLPSYRPDAIPDFAAYSQFIGANDNIDGYHEPFNQVPGGVYYVDKGITDPSIFNFYKQLLDGPNKHEWKSWTAFDLAVDQTFFDDRIGLEFAYDQQNYTEGAEPFMQGTNYGISIDVNQTYADGTPNPNVGRPYVANATSGGEDYNYQTNTKRQVYRITPTF